MASCCVCFLQERYPDLTIMQAIYWSVVTATTIGRPTAGCLTHPWSWIAYTEVAEASCGPCRSI